MNLWKKAYQAIDYSVLKQSTVLSYMDIFMYLGIMFLCCIPIIFFIKRKNKINPPMQCIKSIKKLRFKSGFFMITKILSY
jgi:hypothetical protein